MVSLLVRGLRILRCESRAVVEGRFNLTDGREGKIEKGGLIDEFLDR